MSLTVPGEFVIRIDMTSDWHVGSGSGRGEIDSAVQRDADGIPYIPAKTLTGILRDGCEQVALALDNGDGQGIWHKWVGLLFGDQPALATDAIEPAPRPALLSIRSAHFPQELRHALKENNVLKNAISFVKPGVAIDSATGSAKPDFLRFEEVVRMGAILTSGHCTLDFSEASEITDAQKKVAYALLIAGAKMVDRLGGKRRRGNGTCTITINNQDKTKTNEWIEWFQKNHGQVQQPPEWKPERLDSQNSQLMANSDTGQSWYRIPLTVETKTPVVIPKRTVGNVVESLDHIPGRYFLRHLHRAIGKYMDVSGAIARGDLVITNATIAIDDKPGRPTPFCLFGEKLDGGLSKGKGVYNRFQEAEPIDAQGKEIQTKGERSGYLGEFDGSCLPEYESVALKIFTHNTIRDDVQRPTSDVGGVYSYEAIPSGITLMAELRLPQSIKEYLEDKASKNLSALLKGNLRIGQSKKDQYGSVHVKAGKPEIFDSSQQLKDDKLLYVWFLSDVLLRDQRLNPTTNPDVFREMLASELGVTLEERPDSDLLSLMMKSRRTESWQVRWGLPRPSMLGWQAGSCIVYKIQGDKKPSAEKLSELEAKGIGDRRAEGYGQICFNDPLLKKPLSSLEQRKPVQLENSAKVSLISNKNSSFDYARTIEKAAWCDAITNSAMAIAADENKRADILGIKILHEKGQEPKSQPPMSQLGGLRSATRRLTKRKNSNSVTQWIHAIKQTDKWPAGSLAKIEKLVTDFNLIWQELGDFSDLTLTQCGKQNCKVVLQEELWAEAVRNLVDAIIRAHKRALEDAEHKAEQNSKNGETKN
jgi:CRISPR-associated protein Csx10